MRLPVGPALPILLSMLTVALGLSLSLVLLGTLAGALVCTLDRRRAVLRYERGYQQVAPRD